MAFRFGVGTSACVDDAQIDMCVLYRNAALLEALTASKVTRRDLKVKYGISQFSGPAHCFPPSSGSEPNCAAVRLVTGLPRAGVRVALRSFGRDGTLERNNNRCKR